MDRPIELVPLICANCSTAIPAEPDEFAWVCAQCGQGWALEPDKGLSPLEIHYAAGIPAAAMGKPFWVADGQVSLRRQSYRSVSTQNQEAEAFWSRPRRFFIPAYQTTLEALLNHAVGLLLNPPELTPGPSAHFEPITLPLEDVRSAAEFVVVAIEASRKDKLKTLDFSLQISPPVLWVLP